MGGGVSLCINRSVRQPMLSSGACHTWIIEVLGSVCLLYAREWAMQACCLYTHTCTHKHREELIT